MTRSCSRSTGSITTSAKALAEAVRRALPVVEVEDLPAEPGKLIQQGLLDVVALVDAKRLRGHTCRSRGARVHEAAVATGTSSSITRPFAFSTTEISNPLCKFIQNAGPVPR